MGVRSVGLLGVAAHVELGEKEEQGEDIHGIHHHDARRVALAPVHHNAENGRVRKDWSRTNGAAMRCFEDLIGHSPAYMCPSGFYAILEVPDILQVGAALKLLSCGCIAWL